MQEPSTTTEIWGHRVEAWRASGERAEVFSRREGYAASTLRWWASKLKRNLAAPVAPPTEATAATTPEVRLARVIRVAPPTVTSAPGPAITMEVSPGGVRIGVGVGADRATLALVLDLLGVRP